MTKQPSYSEKVQRIAAAEKRVRIAKAKELILETLKYKTTKPYFARPNPNLDKDFADLNKEMLHNAYQEALLYRTDPKKGILKTKGLTTDDVARALQQQMNYNPDRWAEAPGWLSFGLPHFLWLGLGTYKKYKPVEIQPTDTPELDETKSPKTFYGYLHFFNELTHGRDVVFNQGDIKIGFNTAGHASKEYWILSDLFHALHEICSLNMADFKDKESPNRDGIVVAMSKIYPGQVRPTDFGLELHEVLSEYPEVTQKASAPQLDAFRKYKWVNPARILADANSRLL